MAYLFALNINAAEHKVFIIYVLFNNINLTI
jgi:hypothetical protein